MELEKDFDELLDEFIMEEAKPKDFSWIPDTAENSACKITPKMEAFTSKGVTYQVPVACEPEYRFRKLTLLSKLGEMDSESGKSSLIIWDDKEGNDLLFVELDKLRQANDVFPSSGMVSILLYRVGNPNPLNVYSTQVKDTFDSVAANLSDIDGEWEPGEYFLLVVNALCSCDEEMSHWDTFNSHLRFSFRLLASGKTLPHPSITRFSLSPDRMLTVSLDGKTSRMDEFRFLMYDEDWVDVADSQVLIPYRNALKNLFYSYSPLLDGNYKVVMLHNEEPCYLISVRWAGNRMEECSWTPLDMDSPYYILSKYMADDWVWNRLCKIPGCRSIRKALVGRYGYKVLNKWRSAHDIQIIEAPVHLSVALADGIYDNDLSKLLGDFVNPSCSIRERNCEVLLEPKNTFDPYQDMRDALKDCSGSTFCLHHLSALNTSSNGKVFLHMLEEALQDSPTMALMLVGTRSEIDLVFENSPFISRLIFPENRFHTERYSVREQIKFLESYWDEMEVMLTPEASSKLENLILSNREIMGSWRKEELKNWWHKEIYPRYMKRLFMAGETLATQKPLCHLAPEDICLPSHIRPVDEFAESVRELNGMVGLEDLKRSMTTLFNRTRFDKMRREAGLPVLDKGGYHMIFTGNPGTGKTTVAKLIGQVFHSLGLLSKGGVIVTERTKLVGRYLGETEKNMSAVLEQARGNVLFIDEAYSLCDNDKGDRRDFGCRVLESLLTVLAQKNPDMIVILAGYEKEMNQMLEMNPGMKGRFPYKFNFEDYNADELYQIAYGLLEKSEYVLTPEAEIRLRETIEETVLSKDAFFHNARWVEQYIMDGVVSAMSDRLMSSPFHLQSRKLLQTVEVQDIETAYQKMKPKPVAVAAPRKRIGFVA